MQMALYTYFTPKPKPEGEMAHPSHNQVAEENKGSVKPHVPQTSSTVTMKGTASHHSVHLTSGTPTCKVREALTFPHP